MAAAAALGGNEVAEEEYCFPVSLTDALTHYFSRTPLLFRPFCFAPSFASARPEEAGPRRPVWNPRASWLPFFHKLKIKILPLLVNRNMERDGKYGRREGTDEASVFE